ncbi:MAG: MFS transporter [candidate division WOR-3 bacterium]
MVNFLNFFRILKNRNFFIFSISQVFSQIGDKVNHFSFFAILKDLAYGNPLAFSFLSASITLPVILFSPFAGILIDRFDRKRIMVFSEILRAFFVFLILFIGIKFKSLILLYFFIFFLFLSTLFSNVSKISSIPECLKSKEEILTANSFNNMIVRISTLLAMFSSGILIELKLWKNLNLKGYDVVLFLNSFLFIMSGFILSFLSIKRAQMEKEKRNFFKDLKEGLKIANENKNVLFVYLTIISLAFLGSIIYVILSILIQQVLSFGTKGMGIIGTFAAFGTILSAFLFGNYGKNLNKIKVITYSFFSLAVIIFLFSFINRLSFLILISFIGGLFIAPIMISQDTIIHEEVNVNYRGRIFSFREFFVNTLFVIFGFLNGISGKYIGAKETIIICSIFLFFLNIFSILIYNFKK